MLFLTNELAKKAEITILSAWETTRPGLQAGSSWVERKGYIRGSVARDSHLSLWINPVQSCVQFVFKLSLILPRWLLFMSAMSITKDEVSDLIKLNNQQLCFHTLWSGDKIATYNGIFYDYFFKRTLLKDTLMAKNSEVLPWAPLKKVTKMFDIHPYVRWEASSQLSRVGLLVL